MPLPETLGVCSENTRRSADRLAFLGSDVLSWGRRSPGWPSLRKVDHGELPSVPKGYLDAGGGRGRGAETGLAGGVLGFSWRLACHQSGLLDQSFLEGLSPQSRVPGTRLATWCWWGSCFGLAFSPMTRVRVLKVCVWGCVCMWMGVPVHVWLGVHGLPWLLAAFQVIAANAFPVLTPWVGVRSTF